MKDRPAAGATLVVAEEPKGDEAAGMLDDAGKEDAWERRP